LLVISRGRLVADGPVAELLGRAQGAGRITVEVSGDDVAARLGALDGAAGVTVQDHIDGRIRVSLATSGAGDLRPRVFELAKAAGWTLYELHYEAGSLEDLFRELTADGVPGAGGTP
jgi:ABC-2 type transport system ATP-binding protein